MFYERLTKKVVYKTYKIFISFIGYINSKDRVVFYGIKSGWKPF